MSSCRIKKTTGCNQDRTCSNHIPAEELKWTKNSIVNSQVIVKTDFLFPEVESQIPGLSPEIAFLMTIDRR